MQLYELSVHEIVEGVRSKKFSALEVFDSCLNRALTCENKLAALITTTVEAGRAQAQLVDERISKGDDPGPLGGVPVVLKDNLCTRGTPTGRPPRKPCFWRRV